LDTPSYMANGLLYVSLKSSKHVDNITKHWTGIYAVLFISVPITDWNEHFNKHSSDYEIYGCGSQDEIKQILRFAHSE